MRRNFRILSICFTREIFLVVFVYLSLAIFKWGKCMFKNFNYKNNSVIFVYLFLAIFKWGKCMFKNYNYKNNSPPQTSLSGKSSDGSKSHTGNSYE